MTRIEFFGWCLPLAVGLMSRLVLWSGWIYFGLAFLVPIHRRWRYGSSRGLSRERRDLKFGTVQAIR